MMPRRDPRRVLGRSGTGVAALAATGGRRVVEVGILIVLAVAALLFRWQGDAWTVVAGKLLVVVVLYLVTIYLIFGVGIRGLP